jgi:hypothetical protein
VVLSVSELPKIFSGIPRSGTTFIHLNHWRQQVIDNPDSFPGFVDESYRILPIYSYKKSDVPVFTTSPDDVDISVAMSYQGFAQITKPSNEYYQLIRERIEFMKQYPHSAVSQKFFGFDYWIVNSVDPDWMQDIIHNNHFVYVLRKDVYKSIASYMYAAAIDNFHFFEQPDNIKKVFYNTFSLRDLMRKNILALVDLMKTTPYFSIMYLEDYKKKDNSEQYNQSVRTIRRKDLLPQGKWSQTPVIVKKDYEKIGSNYNQFLQKARIYLSEIVDESNGILQLEDDELTVNVEKLG